MAGSFLKGTYLALKARLWELGKISISTAVDHISSLSTNSLSFFLSSNTSQVICLVSQNTMVQESSLFSR